MSLHDSHQVSVPRQQPDNKPSETSQHNQQKNHKQNNARNGRQQTRGSRPAKPNFGPQTLHFPLTIQSFMSCIRQSEQKNRNRTQQPDQQKHDQRGPSMEKSDNDQGPTASNIPVVDSSSNDQPVSTQTVPSPVQALPKENDTPPSETPQPAMQMQPSTTHAQSTTVLSFAPPNKPSAVVTQNHDCFYRLAFLANITAYYSSLHRSGTCSADSNNTTEYSDKNTSQDLTEHHPDVPPPSTQQLQPTPPRTTRHNATFIRPLRQLISLNGFLFRRLGLKATIHLDAQYKYRLCPACDYFILDKHFFSIPKQQVEKSIEVTSNDVSSTENATIQTDLMPLPPALQPDALVQLEGMQETTSIDQMNDNVDPVVATPAPIDQTNPSSTPTDTTEQQLSSPPPPTTTTTEIQNDHTVVPAQPQHDDSTSIPSLTPQHETTQLASQPVPELSNRAKKRLRHQTKYGDNYRIKPLPTYEQRSIALSKRPLPKTAEDLRKRRQTESRHQHHVARRKRRKLLQLTQSIELQQQRQLKSNVALIPSKTSQKRVQCPSCGLQWQLPAYLLTPHDSSEQVHPL